MAGDVQTMKRVTFCRRNTVACTLVSLFLLLLMLTYSKKSSVPDIHHSSFYTTTKPHKVPSGSPIILLWDKLGDDGNIKCGLKECSVTHNRKVTIRNNNLGILFYGTYFARDGLPFPRKSGHIWAVFHEESPMNNDWLFCATGAMELFNLTATFQRDSHYPLTTMWLHNESDLISTKYTFTLKRKNELRKEGLAPIVFVHSDCNTPSDRSHYMRMLQKQIQIDSYGKCEHNKDFPKSNMAFKSDVGPMSSDDFYRLIAQYKFAFAFENAVCDDYVTEKFWRPLELGVVPIAFGSSKVKDYDPSQHSIISISDFFDVKDLAEYIAHLDANDTAYSEYLSYKRSGITNPTLKTLLGQRHWGEGRVWNAQYRGFQCYICDKLHEQRRFPEKRWHGNDIGFRCPKPKLFNNHGRYVLKNKDWERGYNYADYYLEVIRDNIEKGSSQTEKEIHQLARELEQND